MTTINFNTSNQTFRQIFGNGLSYHVPRFQRDYSWEQDEWDDLWMDILVMLEEDGDPAHYMGYLVLQSSDSKRFEIIDGQQRLTTISLIVLSGLSYLKDLIQSGQDPQNNMSRVEQLQRNYIGYIDPVTLVSQPKLELNRHNNRFYQNHLVPLAHLPQRNLNSSEHRLRKAFIWFKNKIESHFRTEPNGGEKFAGMLEVLADRFFFTVITVNNELNAFTVFETLNARGVRLSATDLLKNYLFSIICTPNRHESELKTIEDHWERIVGLLGSESFPEFLRIYWNSRNKLVRKAHLFKTIRRSIDNRESAFQLLRDLDHSADIYAALRDPGESFWNEREREALEQLLMFYVRQPYAMLMACHNAFFDTDRNGFIQILRAVSVVSFRYNVICNLQTHDQENLYNDVAQKVTNRFYDRPRDVITALTPVYPDDGTFKAAFSQKELKTTSGRNKKVVKYILSRIERQLSEKVLDTESSVYSLEHILPENTSDVWPGFDESKLDRLIYRLGNMTLLETRKNKSIGNSDYSIKRERYRSSEFRITQTVAEYYDKWSEQKIDSRQKKMADIASSIWRIDA
ncbi:MAG: DUF262 domain-containing protein [Gammaproteobacteria bacterium]|nr:DUF262 domain-containing protein [Gammaproteobacteria bacterium]